MLDWNRTSLHTLEMEFFKKYTRHTCHHNPLQRTCRLFKIKVSFYRRTIFACLDPDSQSRSGSTDPIESRLKLYQKQRTVNFKAVFWIISVGPVLRIRIGSGFSESSDPGGRNDTQKSKFFINLIFLKVFWGRKTFPLSWTFVIKAYG